MTTPVAAASRSGTAPPPAPKAAASRAPAAAPSRTGGQQRQRQSRPRVEVRRKPPSGTPYQNVILAEFVGAVLLVAATPMAKKNQPGLSPYEATDLLQLVAITVLYLILALLSATGNTQARFSAWFGGLILLAVGLGEAARLAKLLDVFGLASGGSSGSSASAGTGSTAFQEGAVVGQVIQDMGGQQ